MYWCCLFAAVTTTFSIIKGLSYLKKEKPIPCRVAKTHCFFKNEVNGKLNYTKKEKKCHQAVSCPAMKPAE